MPRRAYRPAAGTSAVTIFTIREINEDSEALLVPPIVQVRLEY
jgi:hypothetical protein